MEDFTRVFQAAHRVAISGWFFKCNSNAGCNEFADCLAMAERKTDRHTAAGQTVS
jgi:hypothetical protein